MKFKNEENQRKFEESGSQRMTTAFLIDLIKSLITEKKEWLSLLITSLSPSVARDARVWE